MATAAAAMAMSAGAYAETFTWTNAAGGTWDTPANWGGASLVTDAADTTLDFSTLAASYTSTNNVATTAANPFTLNRLVVGNAGTPVIAGGYLRFVGPDATIQKRTGGGTPNINGSTTISFADTLTLSGSNTEAVTFGARFTGTGGLVINGLSAVVTNPFNDYTGGTTLSAGELVIFADSTTLAGGALARGPIGTGTLTINGGNIRTNSATPRLLYNAVHVGGDFSFGGGSANTLTLAGQMTLSGTRTINMGGGKTLVLAGPIGGGGVTFAGSGIAILGGGETDTVANTYTGVTNIGSANATVTLDKASGTNAIAGNVNFTAGSLVWNRAEQIADTATLTVGGGTLVIGADETVANITQTGGAIRINGGVNVTVTGTLSITGGTGPIFGGTLAVGGLQISRPDSGSSIYEALSANTGSLATPGNTPGTLKLMGDVTLAASTSSAGTRIRQGGPGGFLDLNGAQRTFNIGDGNAAEDLIISASVVDRSENGGGGFRKTGLGTLALVGDTDSSVNGENVIEAGRLVVYNYAVNPAGSSSAVGSGRLTIGSAGTLGGNGRVAAVTVSGTIDPSVPTANFGGSPNLTTPNLVVASATFNPGGTLKLDGIGGTSDLLIVNGLLDLSADGDVLALSGVLNGSDTVLARFGSVVGQFDIVTFNGSALPSDYSIRYSNGQMTLSVPEPGSLGLLLLGGAMTLRRKRRH